MLYLLLFCYSNGSAVTLAFLSCGCAMKFPMLMLVREDGRLAAQCVLLIGRRIRVIGDEASRQVVRMASAELVTGAGTRWDDNLPKANEEGEADCIGIGAVRSILDSCRRC